MLKTGRSQVAHGAALVPRGSCHPRAQNIRVPTVMLISFVSASSSL